MLKHDKNNLNFLVFKEQFAYAASPFDFTPFVTALGALFTLFNLVLVIYKPINPFLDFNGSVYPILALATLATVFLPGFLSWSINVFREAELGLNTYLVRHTLTVGMYLFILSEALLFVSFFWAYFYITTAPQFDVATVLPRDIKPLNYLSVPLYNTFILVLSGLAATVAEKGAKVRMEAEEQEIEQTLSVENPFTLTVDEKLKNSKAYQVRFYTLAMYALAIVLGLIFTALQLFEYKTTSFSAEDSVYGSIFFLTTGFHGLHVIVGTIFLIFSMYQQYKYEVTLFTNVSIKFANIYWHFVDAIWIGLYLLYYYYITLR
jgi:heme/copper-type cytochrome/quinol oxidase subunit 3